MEAIKFNNYYRNFEYLNYPDNNIYTYKEVGNKSNKKQDFTKVAVSIKNVIQRQNNNKDFINLLLTLASNKEDQKIINSIFDDEKKYNEKLEKMYLELTGDKFTNSRRNNQIENFYNYDKNLEKAFFNKLDSIEEYKRIKNDIHNREHIYTIMDIINDELKHANLYNFLITSNKK